MLAAGDDVVLESDVDPHTVGGFVMFVCILSFVQQINDNLRQIVATISERIA